MIFTAPVRPVSRLRVFLGALVFLGSLVGIIAGSELLRYPPGDVDGTVPPSEGDIRDELVCPPALPPDDELEADPRTDPTVTVSSEDLYDCPSVYDGRSVRYEGEVVGALLHRSDGAWTQLNDDLYAGALGPLPLHRDYRGANAGVGVFLPAALADRVETVGGPRARGDVLTVVGTFHRVDPDSREVAVIRAETASVARAGEPFDHDPLPDRRLVGIVLALAAVGVTTAHRMAISRVPLRELRRPDGRAHSPPPRDAG